MITVTQIKKEKLEIPSQFYKCKDQDRFICVRKGVDIAGFTECDELEMTRHGWEMHRHRTFFYSPSTQMPITAEEYAAVYTDYIRQEVLAANEFGYMPLYNPTGEVRFVTEENFDAVIAELQGKDADEFDA